MPPQEQADLWMALRDRMKTNWAELTLQEKKAGMLPLTPSPLFSLPHLHELPHPKCLSASPDKTPFAGRSKMEGVVVFCLYA
jgi:hypothetical protein